MAHNKVFRNAAATSIREDGEAEAEVGTGQLLGYGADADHVVPHGTAAAKTNVRLSQVPAYAGSVEPGGAPPQDYTYSVGEHVRAKNAGTGEIVALRLDAAITVAAADVGSTALVSAGNGNFRLFDGAGGDTEAGKLAVPLETADTTDGNSALVLAKVI